ncbi:hypothetical protein QBC33DRAFT_533622 [Phialemonium atrogriseum]|uniref:Uncharacterized protein n=1 Tax=Phialemonium atrogriseum TaxID=1093897 RepID=A0AAJ0C3D4_9PEZI|nr:uncharacterized protein QBC33DRAFT_533622 [Phialemonium atrogriseum]KAK1768767.1 hypothetical protein QBC33DRAFT_533622 [Phialemonium atrogriseum]
MDMPNDHLPLQPRCGTCADRILRHERVVTWSGNNDSTACTGHTRPFPFPQHGMSCFSVGICKIIKLGKTPSVSTTSTLLKGKGVCHQQLSKMLRDHRYRSL